ncbi:MAG: translation elongation factor Ts [Candidatus Magasanikbacteria bacterium]|jgi:elongation factor Ts|nr:translation elongation factor Ts [Candidatus Magasanikbacteria bacterium]MBT4315196.1 translation elongation factor Ts [Candidatus Magasanikbacteria bacterium]MBT4547347.1 translation elongation factor Ts [Candidatus Magasanikbacteria bacterium]MBT6819051.1 translation elongation factor Ts [Candidatus Magasanikbacteria bacterium]
MSITAQDIAALRAKTGAGMMDCKKALEGADGNIDKAIDELRKKGIAKAAKRADKIAAEGLVYSYIHGNGKIGVLLELNCETDFVAKTDKFKDLAHDMAMHIAAVSPKYLSREEVSEDEIAKEKDVYAEQLKNEGKPEEMIEKIVEGKLGKFYSEICLLEQSFIKDEDKTVEQVLVQASAEIGEKVTLRRFSRFELGEGIEKKACDFAEEVAEQMGE